MLDYFISVETFSQVRLPESPQVVKQPPLAPRGRTTFVNIVQARFGLCVYWAQTLEAVLLFLCWFWGLLRGPPEWSGRSGSLLAATALWVSVSGVHPPAGGWRPASTASPQPSDLRAPNEPKAADPRRKTAAKTTAKPLG